MATTAVEGFVSDYRTAKAQGHGTDADRIKKQLAALGFDHAGKPLASPERAAKPAAEERKAAAGSGPEHRAEAPKGRTAASPRQSRT